MSSPAIIVEGLGKRYRLGGQQAVYRTFREDLVDLALSPFRGRRKRQAEQFFWALDDVNLEIREGEAIGLIGSNGAGKSTLLKILSRVTAPTTGRATLYGRVGSLLEVGTGFHPELTGRENIFLSGTILGMNRAEVRRKLEEIVDFSEIEDFLDTPVKHYSSGMYVRLAFAVAANLEPEILLVDEVLAVGDAGFQQKCLGKMTEVTRGGRTVVFVSHNMEAVQRLCERAILIGDGQVRTVGEAAEVVATYLTEMSRQGQGVIRVAPGSQYTGVSMEVDGKPSSSLALWHPYSPMRFTVWVDSEAPCTVPGVDISIYTAAGQRLLTVSSDQLVVRDGGPKARRWRLEIELAPLQVTAQRLYCDVGVRPISGTEHELLWNHAAEIEIQPTSAERCFTFKSLLWSEAKASAAVEDPDDS